MGGNRSKAGKTLEYPLGAGHKADLVVANGEVDVGGQRASAREEVAITDEPSPHITALADSELVLVDSA